MSPPPRIPILDERDLEHPGAGGADDYLNELPLRSPPYSATAVPAIAHHEFGRSAFPEVSWPDTTTVDAMEQMGRSFEATRNLR